MRSFEERKAEVFRRSENRIKERRKARSRALAVCIPLCLIITVWSVMVLPAMLPVNNKKSGATDERAENTSGAAYSQNEYVRIETKNSATKDQTAVLKDDPAEIAGVYRLVQSMLNNIVQTGEHKNEDQEGQQTSGSDAYDAAPVYMIIFTATDGGQTCYMLNDHILIDNAAKKETVLTEEQYVQLLQALGVVLKKGGWQMKRVISALLSVLLLGCLTACSRDDGQSKNGDSRSGTLRVAIGETNTDFDGVSVRILNLAEDEGKTQLNVSWVNKTFYEVVYGESYDIEREQNGKWSSCAINGLNFTAIGYELGRKATQTKSYTLSNSFDISENGKYRFVTDCIVYEKGRGGESTKCKLWAEFTVTRTGDSGGEVQKAFIDFNPQYIRTDGYCEDADYPVVKIIRSVDGLKAYYNASKDKYDLERKDKVYSDTTIGFLDACDKYNEAYFEKQILVMVLLEEGSGSNRHNVDNVKLGSDGKLYISIRSIIPEVGTADMAAWHILIEPEADIDVASESDVIVCLDGVNPKIQSTTARESGNYSNIEFTIPHDWNYETEHGDNANEYCISFWPADQYEGKIKVWCYTAFGVCGTGLEEKEITVGAYKARKGTYGNKEAWDFIIFTDMPGSYVAINEGAEKWWNRYGDEAMQILGTVKIADGIIGKSQAIEIAKKGITAKYDRTDAIFDSEKGLWTVSFYEKNRSEKVQSITVSYNGKVINKEAAK